MYASVFESVFRITGSLMVTSECSVLCVFISSCFVSHALCVYFGLSLIIRLNIVFIFLIIADGDLLYLVHSRHCHLVSDFASVCKF